MRRRLQFGPATWRADVPVEIAYDPLEHIGPRLYEETDYTVYVHTSSLAPVVVETRDPVLTSRLNSADGGRVVHGVVNFGSQAGMSEFVVRVGNEPELMFSVEVFPSKIDYRTDYQQLIADVQEILTALALEYLRSTYQLGLHAPASKPSHLEWLTMLRFVAKELERAFAVILQRPHRVLMREPELVRVDRVRRPDSALRNAVVRRRGAGQLLNLNPEVSVREMLPSSRPRPSLDTPEHRWLGAQLVVIRRRLAGLRVEETQRTPSLRRLAILKELDGLLAAVTRLSQSEPIISAPGAPPAGFASLQLLRTPGYREAYQACLILSLGLRIQGGPMRLSLKDISELYEYWCLLALLREISDECGKPLPAKDLLRVEHQGLRVWLQRGREHVTRFTMPDGRVVSVTFNPLYPTATTAQRPDIVVAIGDRDWPTTHLVLDAKYRIETSSDYIAAYGSPGPPEDAINVLHRYRDAILETGGDFDGTQSKRTIIQAAALFPYQDEDGRFEQSRLWKALASVGIGAIPFLPGETSYVRDWLRTNMRVGSWSLAERAIPHRSSLQIASWRSAAAEPVLIGVLRSGDEAEHLRWIIERGLYYVPLVRSDTERRQYAARYVAIYSPVAIRAPGAVTHVGSVVGLNVVRRDAISTPWSMSRDPTRLQILYRLADIRALVQPVVNQATETPPERFSQPRWTTKLALDRASDIHELFLETEQEWRLYEELRATASSFAIRAGRRRPFPTADERGRAWFVGSHIRAQYRGAAGFLILSEGRQEYCARPVDVATRFDAQR